MWAVPRPYPRPWPAGLAMASRVGPAGCPVEQGAGEGCPGGGVQRTARLGWPCPVVGVGGRGVLLWVGDRAAAVRGGR